MSQSLLFVIFLFRLFPLTNAEERLIINDDEFRLIIYTFLIVGTLNAIGCCFVFYKTFIRWTLCKRNRKKLVMSYRLPFYNAIAGTNHVLPNKFFFEYHFYFLLVVYIRFSNIHFSRNKHSKENILLTR